MSITTDERRQKIFGEINRERDYQDGKWGHESDDTKNTPFHWVTWIVKYATMFTNGTWKPEVNAFRFSMLKAAAICVAAIESLDRQREERGKAFYE